MTNLPLKSIVDRWVSALRNHPKRFLFNVIVKRSATTLVLTFIAAYALSVSLFAMVYYYSIPPIFDGNGRTISDYLFLSFNIQSTIGYMDAKPQGIMQAVAASQVLVGLALTGILIALIVTRIIQRSPKLVFPDKLAFDPDGCQLVAAFWNRELNELINVQANLMIRSHTAGEKMIQLKDISLEKRSPSYVGPMWVVLIRSIPGSCLAGDTGKAPVVFTRIGADDEIHFIVSATSVSSSSTFLAKKTYLGSDVVCGKYFSTLPTHYKGDWRDRKFRLFGKVEATQVEKCRSCPALKNCVLCHSRDYIDNILSGETDERS